jgi:hypothetical protein
MCDHKFELWGKLYKNKEKGKNWYNPIMICKECDKIEIDWDGVLGEDE